MPGIHRWLCLEGPFCITWAQSYTRNAFDRFVFTFPPITLSYMENFILYPRDCCHFNQYEMDVVFSGPDIMFGRPNRRWNPEQTYISQEEKEISEYLKDVKKENTAEEPLYPYLLERMAFFNEMEKCLLCCSEIPKQYYYECLTCHDDILIFLEIMHYPKFWIPLGWGEFASHPI